MKRMRTSVRFRAYKNARREMARAYPATFPAKGRRPPLKVGILKDIINDGSHGLTAGRVRLFLSIWTRSTSYLRSVAMRRPRQGLDGTAVGAVTESHAREAEAELQARQVRAARFDKAA